MRKTFITIAAAGAVLASTAAKASNNCEQIYNIHGIFMRAALVCNPAWVDAPVFDKLRATIAKECHGQPDSISRKYIEEGFVEFDNQERANGHQKECRDTFKFMDAMGHYPYMPPTAPAR